MNLERSERIEIPVLPLRDVVVYPHMVIPLFVGREKSIACLEAAMDNNKQVLLVAQKQAETDEPTKDDLFSVGTVATILQLLKLPDGTVKVLVEGQQRAKIHKFAEEEFFTADAQYLMTSELHPLNKALYGRAPILINSISVLSCVICVIKDIFKLSLTN